MVGLLNSSFGIEDKYFWKYTLKASRWKTEIWVLIYEWDKTSEYRL